jgi:hypothetical protein
MDTQMGNTYFPFIDTEVLVASNVQWTVQYLFQAQNKQALKCEK